MKKWNNAIIIITINATECGYFVKTKQIKKLQILLHGIRAIGAFPCLKTLNHK